MRKFSSEEKSIIRRLVSGEGYSRNLINLISDRNLGGVRFVADRETLSAALLFEAIEEEPTHDQILEMGERQDEISKMLILYVGLFRYLEKHDLAISYRPAESASGNIAFGKGAINRRAYSWKVNDTALVGLIAEYFDKEIIPAYPLRTLVENDFVTEEEKRFKSQVRATWTAIWVSIGIGIAGLAISSVGIYLRISSKHNEALQSTAQNAAALWVPSAASGCSGGN